MGRGRRSGSSTSSGSDLAPRRTKKQDDDRGGGADGVRVAAGGVGDRKGASGAGSGEEDGRRRDGYRRGTDSKSSRDGQEREQGSSERYRDGRHDRYGRDREAEQRIRVVDISERERKKERIDYDDRRRYDSGRGRRDRYDPDTSRPEREKRHRTDKDINRSDRDGRDLSHSRMDDSREHQRNDRDERRYRGRDYSLEHEDTEFPRARERELPRSVENRDLPFRTRGKESSRIEESRDQSDRSRERVSSRGEKDVDVDARGGEALNDNKESWRARARDDDGNGGGRWPRRPRESSTDVGDIETAKGRRNESPVQRRVKARMDNISAERESEGEEDEAGRRGKVRKERDYSSDEDRATKKRVGDDGMTSSGKSRGNAAEALAGRMDGDDLDLSLGLGSGKNEGRVDEVDIAMEKAPEITSKTPSNFIEEEEKPVLQINVEAQLRRIASPSPITKPHLPSASESGSGRSDSSRSASPAMSLTPERATFTKPTRATPDIRRGERSPNPSPLSPRSRLPPPSRQPPPLSHCPIASSKLVEEVVLRDDGGVEDDLKFPSLANGDEKASEFKRFTGDVKSDVADGEHQLEEGETLDRWVPGDDNEELLHGLTETCRHPDREKRGSGRGGRETVRNNSNRRQDVSVHDSGTDGMGRYGDHARYRGDEMPTSREKYYDTNRQRKADDFERGVQRDGERDGYRRSSARNRDSGRESERKHVNGDPARSKQDIPGSAKSGDKVEPAAVAKKVERERPQLPPGRSGGVYIPPFKLAQMLKEVDDKSSNEYQRLTWDALRKSINGLVNKVNASNLKNILPELFAENLIRGRGLFARSCMKSQMASPTFTHVFAALVAVVNTKFPELGELLLKRIILQLRRSFKRNDKPVLLAAAKFIAHLVNQQVAHEILALELLTVLLENPTDDSVEVAVGFVKECGATLQNLSSKGLHAIFERFRGILHEGEIDKRVQFMIEGLFAIRKANFQGFAGVLPELDLVEEADQITHELSLEEDLDDESYLDVFKPDPNFLESEKKYEAIKRDILGDDSDEDGGEDGDKDEDEEGSDEEDEEDENEREERMQIQDETETNLVNLRRTIYLTIMSSVDFEEAGHKLLKIKLEPGQEMELCIMLLECCSQERTYLRYYGLLGQRFCLINRVYQENFDQSFVKQYSMIHRLETNKLRNVAKFFAHLLGSDALPWQALGYIRLTEEDTTSSSRIFIKILFQELSEHLGLRKLNERLSDPTMKESFEGIFPRDNPKNTRFAINFFTSIGLGGLTDSLREFLKNVPRLIMQQHPVLPSESEDTSSSESEGPDSISGSGSSTSSGSSTESDTLSDSSSDSQDNKRRKKKRK